jgi:hypothetical protein
MPQGRPPLSEAQRELIGQWIAAGAADDSPPQRFSSTTWSIRLAIPHRRSSRHSIIPRMARFSPFRVTTRWYCDRMTARKSNPGSWHVGADRVRRVFARRHSLAVTGGSPGRLGEVQVWNVRSPNCSSRSPSATTRVTEQAGPPMERASPLAARITLFEPSTRRAASSCFLAGLMRLGSRHGLFSDGRPRDFGEPRHVHETSHLETQRFIDNITSITPGALKGGINAVKRHPSAEQVVVGSADGTRNLQNLPGTRRKIGDDFNLLRAFESMPGRVSAVAYNRDASRIVAGSSDSTSGQVRVYNEADGSLG